MSQGKYWLATIPHYGFTPWLPPGISWIRGQLECPTSSTFLHWQVSICCDSKRRLAYLRELFGPWHFELSRSSAADEYVWKDDTAVDGTRFELGKRPFKRNKKTDWDEVFSLARQGKLLDIDKSIVVRYYGSLKRIRQDYLEPTPMERSCIVLWGPTGTGKSRTAWSLAGMDAYPKDPRTKFWDGYRDQKSVVIDEFRGAIDLSHLLRWLDRYPVIVEVKGSSTVLNATTIWITSNLNPNLWYPNLDNESYMALLRRLSVIHFDGILVNHDTFDICNYQTL